MRHELGRLDIVRAARLADNAAVQLEPVRERHGARGSAVERMLDLGGKRQRNQILTGANRSHPKLWPAGRGKVWPDAAEICGRSGRKTDLAHWRWRPQGNDRRQCYDPTVNRFPFLAMFVTTELYSSLTAVLRE